MTEEARAAVQRRVEGFYGLFVASIAKARGVSPKAVRAGYGEGRVLGAQAALAAGMVDRIATMEQTIERLAGRPAPHPANARAEDSIEDDPPAPVAGTGERPPSISVRRRRYDLQEAQ